MSYYVYAYLTDANKVSSVFSSNDPNIYEALSTSLKDDLGNLDNYFSEYTNAQKNVSEVLKDIINGEVRFPDIPFMYGYVYEKICEYFGEQIYNAEYIWELEEQSAFIPIPFSTDFPYIISVEKYRLQEKKSKFIALKYGIGNCDYEEEIKDLTYILDKAIEESRDLVICVY
ncbi:MAG: hypothetical protein LBG96_09075 [Tannerella sp.]|jgi:hypothetical protein|nr:hypothetical protein [Tannerella sp.]